MRRFLTNVGAQTSRQSTGPRLRTRSNSPRAGQSKTKNPSGNPNPQGLKYSFQKKAFLTDFEAPSTGRFHIVVGSEGNDRTGTYWLSIFKEIPE